MLFIRRWQREKIKQLFRKRINIMGHHINGKGQFQSDKYPDLPPDKIVLSFHDPAAIDALKLFAQSTTDDELAQDIFERLDSLLKP